MKIAIQTGETRGDERKNSTRPLYISVATPRESYVLHDIYVMKRIKILLKTGSSWSSVTLFVE